MKGNKIKSNNIKANSAKASIINHSSIKAGSIKDSSIKASSVKDNSIEASSVKDNSIEASSIKDNSIKEFFGQHKQRIEDNGFSERLFTVLECMPKPAPVAKPRHIKYISNNAIIILLSAFIGVALFSIFGGYSVVIESLVSLGSVVEGITLITPQFVISICFLLGSLFFLGKFAIEAE